MSKERLTKVSGTKPHKKFCTDDERLDAKLDKDIDLSDSPELTPEWFARAKVVLPEKKRKITIRLDLDLANWFKDQAGASGYQKLMRQVLHTYRGAVKQEWFLVNPADLMDFSSWALFTYLRAFQRV